LTVSDWPQAQRLRLRTTNGLERINFELNGIPSGIDIPEYPLLPVSGRCSSGRVRRGMDDRQNRSQLASVMTSPESNRSAGMYRKEVALPKF
jgi:hypothetical protein